MFSATTLAACEKAVQEELTGRDLTSVEFVQNYVQLRFHGPSISAITEPTLEHEGRTLDWNDVDFRRKLCDLINEKVTGVRLLPGEAFELTFSNQANFRVSLRNEDYVTTEAVHFNSADSEQSWQI